VPNIPFVEKQRKVYLGDSVYVQDDGYGLILTTENGEIGDPSNRIYFEPDVIHAFKNYVKNLEEADGKTF
jgi:hypothetical protein